MDTPKHILLLVFLSVTAVKAEYYGELVGNLSRLAHDVSGKVYIVSSTKLRLREFHYDGKGPDAYFLYGVKNEGPQVPSGSGNRTMDQYGRSLKLDAFVGADMILNLPDGVTVDMLKWFSVWCIQASADFGNVMFPDSVNVPAKMAIGEFIGRAHAVQSGTVHVLDKRTIMIEDFYYDGQGPDAFFWVGMGSQPDDNGNQIPNEEGSMEKLGSYNGETITLTLPADMDTDNIRYLSVWCRRFSENFGEIAIGSLMVPPYTMYLEGYHGKMIGELNRYAHEVRGTVYAVDSKHIRIRNFHYDGQGPDAYFWIGTSEEVDESGMILANEMGTEEILEAYEDDDIVLTLPDGKTLTDIRWLSVWCRKFTANFGDIYFPSGYVWNLPIKRSIGTFSSLAHGVSSGTVTLEDIRTMKIEMLNYDGQGPDAYFYVGTGDSPNGNGMIIADERGSMEKLGRYTGQTILIRLPEDKTFFDIDWVSIWCVEFTENFGHVLIPDDLNVPPYIETKNCVKLNDNFNVAWEIMGDYIHFEFTGRLDPQNGYMSFGISGSTETFSMAGADVIVAYVDDQNKPVADDYLINAYAQCSNGVGACRDSMQDGDEDNEDVEGHVMDGVTYISFKRKLNTGDDKDKVYSTSGETSVVWAMGRYNADTGLVTKHTSRITETLKIEFGRPASSNCPDLGGDTGPVPTAKPDDPWKIPMIMGSEVTMFSARIGPAGPQHKGYSAIRKQSSWGIAWYIDGYLIPELMLKRGVEYTFKVEGGDDPGNPAKYHPFYITDDPIGGYVTLTEQERREVMVYAGVDMNGKPTGVGRYCEYETTSASNEESNQDTFDEYFDTLDLQCEDGEPGMIKWKVPDDAPDVLYYQCYTHKYLGFKIKVVDDFVSAGSVTSPLMTLTLLLALITFAFFKMM